MADIKIGDKVRIKDRTDWPSPPGYKLANSEGTVVKWFDYVEPMEEFQDYVHVKLEKTEVTEYIGNVWPFRVEKRAWMSYSAAPESSIVPKNPYKGVSGSTMEDFENILIVGRNERYLAKFPQEIWQPNTARQLGMYPYSIFPTTDSLVSGLGSSFTSGVPETSSQSSAFIRLPRFSHCSFNCGKGSVSKILAMIPRFDNAGNESGALFFKNADKVYLDLNKLLTKHLAVLAKSGSGKSFFSGVLLEELLERNIPVVVIDPHGEYSSLKYPSEVKENDFEIKPKEFLKHVQEYCFLF